MFFVKIPSSPKIKIIGLGVLIAAVLIGGLSIYARYFQKEDGPTLPSFLSKITEEKPKKENPLDGTKVEEENATRHPLAIMVENHPEARPQSGLSKASIIYEAIAEGGITRFMAIFGPFNADKVGPVRSARTFYLDWALEYKAFYSHVGGNLDALRQIPEIGILDLDQFRYGTKAYWREPKAGKATEHTMYTDTKKLYQIAEDNKWDREANFEKLKFKEEAARESRGQAQEIKIDFSSASYQVVWKYDSVANQYNRWLAGEAHKDAEGNPLSTKNVIIEQVERWPVTTEINESGWAMKTTGTGAAWLYRDGVEIKGTWRKTDRKARTKFYDESGNEIEFNRGVFWYEIVPSEVKPVVS